MLTVCLATTSACLTIERPSYCARGLLSSSPATPPSSAPVYQSRSSRTCSSSHSLESKGIPRSPSSGLVPLTARGVGASHDRFPTRPQPPSSDLPLRGVDSHPTLGTRTLPWSERGVASQLRLSLPRSRLERRWKSPRPRGPSSFRSWVATIPSDNS